MKKQSAKIPKEIVDLYIAARKNVIEPGCRLKETQKTNLISKVTKKC